VNKCRQKAKNRDEWVSVINKNKILRETYNERVVIMSRQTAKIQKEPFGQFSGTIPQPYNSATLIKTALA
jgi:hypothetical protein